ncbi:hypothetical protein G7054_g2945 [Neopestalotiopsis clavispora]|nr:hypothetical protein G7054_g2945 [Neopestalotiopsis clavispora]
MTSREDALFDENKYYFPEGASAILEQRSQQPWLEVVAERDEQGTPGLQLVPNEQKYAQHQNVSGIKGLYENNIAPVYLPVHAANAGPSSLAASSDAGRRAFTPVPPAVTAPTTLHVGGDLHLSDEQSHGGTVSSLREPWSQPEATVTNYEQQQQQQQATWSQASDPEVHNPSWTHTPVPEQNQHYRQPTLESAQQYLAPVASYQPYGYQPSSLDVQADPNKHAYWAKFSEYNGGQLPAHFSPQYSHSHLSSDVASQYSGGNYSVQTHGSDTRTLQHVTPDMPLMNDSASPSSKRLPLTARWSKKRIWLFAGGIFLLVLVGSVLAGVLANKHDEKSSSVSISSEANSTVAYEMKTIRQNSRLQSRAYRSTSGNYTLRLFFQDPDHNVRFTDKSSVGETWTDPTVLDTLEYKPKPYGSIAAGSYIYTSPSLIEFFYIDTDSIIRGQRMDLFADSATERQGSISTINWYPLKTSENSSLSCYFPYLVSQDANDGAQTRWTRMLGQNASNPSQKFWENDTVADAADAYTPDAGLVLLPVAQKFQENGGFVYRKSGGGLGLAMKDYDDGKSLTDVSWTSGTISSVDDMREDSAVGAFVVGRPYTTSDINTYILYQDSSDVIQVVWQDGDGWNGPETYDALKDAEPGTDIECLTQGAWEGIGVQVSRSQDMNRCFFQEKDTGRLREVWFNGTDWRNEGYVPLD